MKVIIDYFKNNMTYTIIFIVSLLACAAAIVALILIRKKREKTLALKQEEMEKANAKTEPAKTTSIFDNLPESFKQAEETNEPANPNVDTDKPSTDEVKPSVSSQEKPANPTEKSAKPNKKSNDEQPVKAPDLQKTQDVQKQANSESSSKPATEEKVEEVKYAGKWVIYKENDRFVADLKASNGEIMLSSESYTSLSGIKSGIETLKKNIASENYAINLDKNGNYVFKIFSTANRLLCIGEGYSSKDQCEKAFASVKRFAKTAVIVNLLETENNDK